LNLLLLKLLGLLIIANGTPVIAKKIFGSRFSYPLDARIKFIDGRPLLGSAKTARGLTLAIIATTLSAPLFGLSWEVGFNVALFAMLGDLLSSFIKRRFNMPPSSMAFGLDQIPESLFPMFVCQLTLGLTTKGMLSVVISFFILELLLSRILFGLGLRETPY
jgi:CDP-diglyceride synthetase